ncbi:hypothetical protein Q9295_03105 [Xinfangfangia sp. CPCC 101601]|uniref:Response regulatory domain-containing protein n=1 Tax=Pseudogemmobacter lacusdianii TaxID=3069608 RepID=A0ABU0VVT7_9RHOB|nr:hypothetical protein [Xinfangfangia sp. CPCC 101601]MDQ2065350.1 hypothetical protein [Xinfangfangia sp. CPCC 101601]
MFRITHKDREQNATDPLMGVEQPKPMVQTTAVGMSLKIGSLVDAPLCPKGLILMCGEIGENSTELSRWAERMRAQVMVVPHHSIPLEWLKKYAPSLDFVIVDADHVGDSGATIDTCLYLRRAVPHLPLVLLSRKVRAHDFTCERMPACDVTLKPPLLHTALTMGIQAAYRNNGTYQMVAN